MTAPLYSNQGVNQPRTLIFGFLAILGGLLFYFLGYGPFTKIIQAQHWVAVQAQVELSSVVTGIVRTKDGTRKIYKVNIQYPYQYNGKSYLGNQYDFNNFYTSDYTHPQNVLSDYPVGKKFICYVNPTNPSESVIQRGLDWYLLPGIMPLLLLGIGIGGLCIRPKIPQINYKIQNMPKVASMITTQPDVIAAYQTKSKPQQQHKNQSSH